MTRTDDRSSGAACVRCTGIVLVMSIVLLVMAVNDVLSQTWRIELIGGGNTWADRLDSLVQDSLIYRQGVHQLHIAVDSIISVRRNTNYGNTGVLIGIATGVSIAIWNGVTQSSGPTHGGPSPADVIPLTSLLAGIVGGITGGVLGSAIRTEELFNLKEVPLDQKRTTLEQLVQADR